MDKIIKKFLLAFILIAAFPSLALITFQKFQTENQPPAPPLFYSSETHETPMPPLEPQKPPFAIPFVVMLLSCGGMCLIWVKYLEKTFITPLKTIISGLKEFDKGNCNIIFKTSSENDFIINAFNTLNSLVRNTKEKEKLKKNYIQNLVHDLRAPILAQDRALKILKDEFSEHELIDGLEKNTEKYIELINLILESYKSESTEMKIEKSEISFNSLINDIIQELSPLAKEKNIKIVYEKPIKNDIVYADYFSINRIMINLIANSIENIENDKTITIKLENNKQTIISVKDNGKGIEEEILKTLFDRYSSNSKTKVVSGLGLNIVKELVEKNNGKINVESELEKFTKFTITLNKKEGLHG